MGKFAFFIFTLLLGWGILIALMPNKFGFGSDTPTPRKIYEQPPITYDHIRMERGPEFIQDAQCTLNLNEEYFQVDCGNYVFISQPGKWIDSNHFHSDGGEIIGIYDKFSIIRTRKMTLKLWKTN